jgi:hypothetical protein
MEINQYAVTASEMKDLSFLDIDQYVSAGVYQSQKVPVSLVKALMLSENIEQILLADMQALALAGDLVSLKNYLIDDGSTLYLVMAAGGVGNQIYQYAIDVTSGLFGTFDLVSGVFTQTSGNTLILEITVGDLQALEIAGTLSLTTLYIVTDALPYKLMCKAESTGVLSRTAEIIDSTLSGQVLYDLQGNAWLNGTIYDDFGNTWNGCLPSDVILGADCFNNTFGQGSNGFTFGDDLKNVTIEAGITGADYSNATTYAFLYNKAYSSTIFQSGGINYHRYFDIANDRIEITDLATPANITYIGGGAGAAQDLQQVLDTGNTSTTTLRIDDGAGNYVRVGTTSILIEDISGNSTSIFADSTSIQNPSFGAGTIKATTLANNVTFELPNKAAGTETFAMLSDISGGGGDVYLANDQTFTGENTFDIPSGSKNPIIVTKGGSGAAIKVTKSSGSGDAIEVADGSVSIADETASTIAHFDASKRIKSLATSTYPSLTELSYVKGVTSAIETQINGKQAKILANCADGTAIIGVTTNQYSKGLLIPANSRGANDAPQIEVTALKTGGAGNLTIRMYWNTTNDLAGSPILLGTLGPAGAIYSSMVRVLMIQVANGTLNATRTLITNATSAVGWAAGSGGHSTVAIDWTINGYLICAVQNTSTLDSSVCVMVKLN